MVQQQFYSLSENLYQVRYLNIGVMPVLLLLIIPCGNFAFES